MTTARFTRRTRVAIVVAVVVLAAIAATLAVLVLKGPGRPHIDSGAATLTTPGTATRPATGSATGTATSTATSTDPATGTTPPTVAPLVVYLGNSFVGGSTQDSGPQDRFPALISADLNTDWQAITADSSGYVARGDDGLTFAALAAEVPADASLVVIVGSDNDAGYAQSQITDAALSTLQTIRLRAPQAQILVVSTPWVSADLPDGITVSRDAVADAAYSDSLPYVDPIADGWWFTGPPEQIGDDGLHPTDLGHAEAAEHLEPVIRQLLYG
ncbi:MAG: lysophospholipase L1-like esterase [Subtercola sp.]|nr:lysophospholipase L1-like esterase [Subtercola sp.]